MELLTEHLGRGLYIILLLSLPAVLTAAGVGLLVGIIQAVTQVQEQTLSAAPKILLVFMLIIFGGNTMLQVLTNYIRESVVLAFQEVPVAGGARLLPPQQANERHKRLEMFFKPTPQGANKRGMMSSPMSLDKGASAGMKSLSTGGSAKTQMLPKASVSEGVDIRRRSQRR